MLDRLCNVVIGYDVRIGAECYLSHGVKIVSACLQDHVLVGSNATIIGILHSSVTFLNVEGQITIGSHSEISACMVVTTNVAVHFICQC